MFLKPWMVDVLRARCAGAICTAVGVKVLPDADSGLRTGTLKGIYRPHHDGKAEWRNLLLIERMLDEEMMRWLRGIHQVYELRDKN